MKTFHKLMVSAASNVKGDLAFAQSGVFPSNEIQATLSSENKTASGSGSVIPNSSASIVIRTDQKSFRSQGLIYVEMAASKGEIFQELTQRSLSISVGVLSVRDAYATPYFYFELIEQDTDEASGSLTIHVATSEGFNSFKNGLPPIGTQEQVFGALLDFENSKLYFSLNGLFFDQTTSTFASPSHLNVFGFYIPQGSVLAPSFVAAVSSLTASGPFAVITFSATLRGSASEQQFRPAGAVAWNDSR